MKNKNIIFCLLLAVGIVFSSNSQDLLDKLNNQFKTEKQYEIATFKTTRIAIGQSVETRKKGIVELFIGNRFWDVPNNTEQNFLADKVSTRFGLNYAITDRFTAGFGYTNFDEIYDGFLKYQLVKQRVATKKSPLSISLFPNFTNHHPVFDY